MSPFSMLRSRGKKKEENKKKMKNKMTWTKNQHDI